MLNLPVVFLCNTIVFMTVLNNRFRIITSGIISGAAYILSLIVHLLISPAFPAGSDYISVSIHAFILLLAAVFLYTNNLAQKIFMAILVVCNYVFLCPVTEQVLGVLPFGSTGFGAVFIGIILYLFFSFLSILTFLRPMHYFANRSISTLSVGLCFAQVLCLFAANGKITGVFGISSFAPRFFLTLFFYMVIAFTVRAAYNAAKYKEYENRIDFRDALLHAEADYFNAMVGNVTNAKTARDHYSYVMNEITQYAHQGNCEGVLNTIADEGELHDPLLTEYSENIYINAVVAAKAAYAKHCGIHLESNIELGTARLKTIEFCLILNDTLAYAIDCAGQSASEDKTVRMTVLPVENRITFEAVYSAPKKNKKRTSLSTQSINTLIASLFEPKREDELPLENVRGIIERCSGTMKLSAAGNAEILRIVINNN